MIGVFLLIALMALWMFSVFKLSSQISQEEEMGEFERMKAEMNKK